MQHHLHVPDTEHSPVASGPEELQKTQGIWGMLLLKITSLKCDCLHVSWEVGWIAELGLISMLGMASIPHTHTPIPQLIGPNGQHHTDILVSNGTKRASQSSPVCSVLAVSPNMPHVWSVCIWASSPEDWTHLFCTKEFLKYTWRVLLIVLGFIYMNVRHSEECISSLSKTDTNIKVDGSCAALHFMNSVSTREPRTTRSVGDRLIFPKMNSEREGKDQGLEEIILSA